MTYKENMAATMDYTNPLILQRADPHVYKHSDGYYYFTASVPEYDRIELRRARSIADLNSQEPLIIWRKHDNGEMSSLIWAPEIHYRQGKWYIYFAAAKSIELVNGMFDHRMFVIENESENPLEGRWVEKGQIITNWESFSLDATTFEHRGSLYLVWAQKDPGIKGHSNIYIAAMSNPWTIQGDQVMISKPEYAWETNGFWVNEGPSVIQRNGRIFISYSASATDYHYCMGLLSAQDSVNLLDPSAWIKETEPVLMTDSKLMQYGPGHNSFTTSVDDSEDIIIYHARTYKEIDGDPLTDPNRHTFARVVEWKLNGMPSFK